MDVFTSKFIELESPEEVIDFARKKISWNSNNSIAGSPVHTDSSSSPFLVLGGGSNVLFTRNYPGTVVRIATQGKEVIAEDKECVLIRVQAGEDWDNLVLYCVSNGWSGLENLSGIPGNAGSSPIQNIGAYGTELKDSFHSMEAIEIGSGEIFRFGREDCHFGYRDSIFKQALKGKFIILSLDLKLKKKFVPNLTYHTLAKIFDGEKKGQVTIQQVREAVLKIRASKLPDPKVLGNAGSFFKNPIVNEKKLEILRKESPDIPYFLDYKPADMPKTEDESLWYGTGDAPSQGLHSYTGYKLAAGWLIEQCGWKGYRDGDAGVHTAQALVLVNYGSATGQQVFDLSEKIRRSVSERFGVDLEREVNIIG